MTVRFINYKIKIVCISIISLQYLYHNHHHSLYQYQKQLEQRRKVRELLIRDYNQFKILNTLHISQTMHHEIFTILRNKFTRERNIIVMNYSKRIIIQ
jgi:hypothetical protein